MLLVVDGNAIVHRAYHALPPLSTKEGFVTNAIYGFVKMLNKAVRQFNPNYLVVAFDAKGPTFRKKMFEEYRAQRPHVDDALIKQLPIIKEMLDAAGVCHLELKGYEADDIIASVVNKANVKTLILTGDKDILQLVRKEVFVVMPKVGLSQIVIYDENLVKKKFGVSPERIVDLKALAGDQSDNYKGAKGIGPKTAVSLISQFGDVLNILRHVDEIKAQKVKEAISKGREEVLLARRLALLKKDLNLDFNLEKSRFSGFNSEVKEFLKKYEIRASFDDDKGDNRKEQKKTKKSESNKEQQQRLFNL